jgi:hypothetical protein
MRMSSHQLNLITEGLLYMLAFNIWIKLLALGLLFSAQALQVHFKYYMNEVWKQWSRT